MHRLGHPRTIQISKGDNSIALTLTSIHCSLPSDFVTTDMSVGSPRKVCMSFIEMSKRWQYPKHILFSFRKQNERLQELKTCTVWLPSTRACWRVENSFWNIEGGAIGALTGISRLWASPLYRWKLRKYIHAGPITITNGAFHSWGHCINGVETLWISKSRNC